MMNIFLVIKVVALSMLSNIGYGGAFIKNTKNCYILRNQNVSIIHDLEPVNFDNELNL